MIINNKKILSVIFLILFSVFNCVNAFADSTTPEPYDKEEFPQTLNDLRRFEIITLGAMPFVTLDVTLGYSGYKAITEGTTFNPFGASSYTQDEQFAIILTSLAISTGIGLTDYIVNLIKRSTKNRKKKSEITSYINVLPISEDPEAIKIDLDTPPEEIEQDIEQELEISVKEDESIISDEEAIVEVVE